VLFLDTSALVKLVFAEDETTSLIRFVGVQPVAVSTISRTELRRVALRLDRTRLGECSELLRGCFEVPLPPEALDQAGLLEPAQLRSLDAIQLTAALRLGGELHAFVAYDARLVEAAQAAGLPVLSPN
jgi:predicted nucleic acid-binding protein